ncbi:MULTISPECIES: nucleoside recognition domain-containing protein [Heyndrickxia]|uniref:nucleoside recognition domain-containing protein n=1 Tax=Heyndrickxia TaxID=2837504 RepID=UPI001B06073C|nr:nucleoside recognition domain-containing protein [Heyndrickxia oleronia]GIN39634.1 putative membrane protein YvoD [Heyndrickxia oleronia]
MVQTFKTGLLSGLKTTWTLGKIIFPVTLIVAILQYTPVLPWIIQLISPLMGIFGLSGDAAIPLVLGNFLNLYAGIAGILSVELTVKEVFTIAVMLSFAHNLLIESSVAVKVGVKVWIMILVRVGLAFISAMIINLVWHGGQQTAHYGMIAPQEQQLSGILEIGLHALEKAALGVYQLAIIVIPLMVGIQLLKDLKVLQWFSKIMSPFTRMLGMRENTSTTLAAGLLFGLAYGAGVMIQAVKEDGVSKKDITLAFIFLVGCHAVVEDTLIFVPLGIPVLPLLFIRLVTAILLTVIIGFIWNRRVIAKNKSSSALES